MNNNPIIPNLGLGTTITSIQAIVQPPLVTQVITLSNLAPFQPQNIVNQIQQQANQQASNLLQQMQILNIIAQNQQPPTLLPPQIIANNINLPHSHILQGQNQDLTPKISEQESQFQIQAIQSEATKRIKATNVIFYDPKQVASSPEKAQNAKLSKNQLKILKKQRNLQDYEPKVPPKVEIDIESYLKDEDFHMKVRFALRVHSKAVVDVDKLRASLLKSNNDTEKFISRIHTRRSYYRARLIQSDAEKI